MSTSTCTAHLCGAVRACTISAGMPGGKVWPISTSPHGLSRKLHREGGGEGEEGRKMDTRWFSGQI